MTKARIRTKSGRLTTPERRRRLSGVSLGPGEVMILDRSRRVIGGKRSGNAMLVELRVGAEFSVDTDVRKLLHAVRVDLAEHYRDNLLAGARASGAGDLPELRESTLARNPGRPNSFGVLTGTMARRWLLLKIVGGPLKASTRLKPNGADGRAFAINRWLKRGIDVQSIDGEAAEVIAAAIRRHLELAVPTSHEGVGTPAHPNTTEGELPDLQS